ncbi:hypothetical protein HPB50_014012 [Hyalomma asiaticum]|uniref:Uncharacterized protein n=1 Tax=Hyalomma asiaticum TaxID=266040 RepID=A0ACB7SHA7_HYAAI|nr:hypothetical protein HPB50_014012 [Hyalomma asiaticum]
MATGAASSSSRRRSSRGISLLPSRDNLVKDLPVGIPEEERLRILLRLCFKRTLAIMAEEVDGFEELHRNLLVKGLSLFDSSEDGSNDRLDMLLKLATSKSDGTNDVLPAAVAADHHEQLKSLVAESKRWHELLAEDVFLEPEVPLVDDGAAKVPVARDRHYEILLESAERSRRKALAVFSRLQAGNGGEEDVSVEEREVDENIAYLFRF